MFLLTCGSSVRSDGNEIELFCLRTHAEVVKLSISLISIPVGHVDLEELTNICQRMKIIVA